MEGRIIAVDFDGTLCSDCYPKIGKANDALFQYLKMLQRMGDRLILWTCRRGVSLKEAIAFCKARGLIFDAVNENLPEVIERFGGDSRKIFADIYIDDRSVKCLELEITDPALRKALPQYRLYFQTEATAVNR